MLTLNSYLLCSLLLIIPLVSAFDPVVYPASTGPTSTTECGADTPFSDQLLEALKAAHQQLPPPGCLQATRDSCADILYCNSSASSGYYSGYYQIQATNGSLVQVYCDMEGTNCGGEGGWTRVAYLNVTDTSGQCPTNFSIEMINETSKDHEGCVALPSDTYEITYSQVCGYARGYSFFSPDAFGFANRDPNEPLSGNYVDGVSITYGTPFIDNVTSQ